MRSRLQDDPDEAVFDRISAKKVRESIISDLQALEGSETFDDRPDKIWIYATLANCHFALGNPDRGREYEAKFRECRPASWQVETFDAGKNQVLEDAAG